MAEAFTELGHEVTLFAPQYVDSPSFLETIGHEPPFRTVYEPCGRSRWKVGLAVARLTRKLHAHQADIVVSRSPIGTLLLSQQAGRSVLEIHAIPSIRRRNPSLISSMILSAALKRVLSRRHRPRVLVLSTQAAQRLRKSRFVNQETVINIVPSAGTKSSDAKGTGIWEETDDLRPTLGYFGADTPGRGLDFILELAHKMPDYRFLVAGPPDPRLGFTTLENVFFLGRLSHDAAVGLMQSCTALLAPYALNVTVGTGLDTTSTASPMKIYDYMAAGRPIFASAVPMVRGALSDDEAFLLPPGDVAAWQSSIRLDLQSDTAADSAAKATVRFSSRHTYIHRANEICRIATAASSEQSGRSAGHGDATA